MHVFDTHQLLEFLDILNIGCEPALKLSLTCVRPSIDFFPVEEVSKHNIKTPVLTSGHLLLDIRERITLSKEASAKGLKERIHNKIDIKIKIV